MRFFQISSCTVFVFIFVSMFVFVFKLVFVYVFISAILFVFVSMRICFDKGLVVGLPGRPS